MLSGLFTPANLGGKTPLSDPEPWLHAPDG